MTGVGGERTVSAVRAVSAADDARFMRRCVTLARRAEGRTAPNPIVGCVVVGARGELLAEGWHTRAGEPHAEAVALARLGGRATGATLYVSLEPCGHDGPRRTAPCVPLIVAAGVARVVYGLADPVAGHGGAARLSAAGVAVDGPVLEEVCAAANRPFVTWATKRRLFVTLKAAMTLDGRIATAAGESRWITGEAARAEVHRMRDRADCVLVGAATVRADDPLLTVRGVRGGRDPVRVVLDGRLSLAPSARLLHSGSRAPTLVATTRSAPESRARALVAAGAEVLRLPGANGRIDLRALCRALARRGLHSMLVEGGADTHAGFLAAGLCDRLVLFVAPSAIGGSAAPAWLGGPELARLAGAERFRFDGPARRLGDDLLLEATPLGRARAQRGQR